LKTFYKKSGKLKCQRFAPVDPFYQSGNMAHLSGFRHGLEFKSFRLKKSLLPKKRESDGSCQPQNHSKKNIGEPEDWGNLAILIL